MKMKGEPLEVKFTHVNNEYMQKTIARATVYDYNVPSIIVSEFSELFTKFDPKWDPNFFEFGSIVKLYAETICKEDVYDPVVGERVARKKLMRHFMSMLQQATIKRIKMLESEKKDCENLKNFAEECEKSIVEYLKEQ